MDVLQWIVQSATETVARLVVLCVVVIAIGAGAWRSVELALRPRRRRC